MVATKVTMQNFRNYMHQEVEFCPGTNLILGQNAQGKTNLLEAVFLCALTKSFRATKEQELVRTGATSYRVALQAQKKDRQFQIRVEGGPGKKQLYFNDIRQKRQADLLSQFLAVLFAPEHLNLVKSGPAERRRFLDLALCQQKPSYFSALSDYNRVLVQKGALLRAGGSRDLLLVFNEQLSALGAQLIGWRAQYIAALQVHARAHHLALSGGREELELLYHPNPQGCLEETDMQSFFAAQLGAQMQREQAAELCLIGPHRDNFELIINGRAAKAYGSQGQQRSAVLSLKLAECELLGETFTEQPVLLLDDVLSELDAQRRDYIVHHLSGRQVIMTCCDLIQQGPFSTGKVFFVENGVVQARE